MTTRESASRAAPSARDPGPARSPSPQAGGAPANPDGPDGGRDWVQLGVFCGLAAALVALAWLANIPAPGRLLWPLFVAIIGAVLLWQRVDPGLRQRWAGPWLARLPQMSVRTLVGAFLVAGGILGVMAYRGQLSQARHVLYAVAAIVIGLGVITAPWLQRLVRELNTERSERIRAAERAEFAARLHDSVLHTLTLIQRSANDPRQVQRLARSQERELRAWLYQPQDDPGVTLTTELGRVAGEVEDAHGVPIDVVCVGDVQLGERTSAALLAAREAMVNAAKYSEAPQISVYAEAEPDRVTIFVRDRGKGFDLDAIPADRLGVRQSIIGRMERSGGRARVGSTPGEGTEIEIQVARHG